MERDEIEQRAEVVLAKVPSYIWDGERLPVPIEDIADSWYGLCIREVEDLAHVLGAPQLPPGKSLSGLLLARPGEIWVNAAEARSSAGRRRFTIGHELGHWELHHIGRDDAVFCRHDSVDSEDGGAATRPWTEEEANFFAAAMLMPARLIKQYYHRDMDFFEFCDRFGTSGAAMGRRLHAVI